MFKKIADYISGKNKVEITGLNIDRLLNGLINSGIVLYDVTRVSHRVVTVCVTDKMLKKLFVYLKPLWYNVVVLSRWSFLHSLKTLVTQRLGLIVGFAVALIAVITFNMFVWDIKISGNELIANDTVIQRLEDLGVKKGCLISQIDKKELAQNLNTQLSEASLISIEIKGVTLIVNIKERIIKPDDNLEELADEIVSKYDCEITKVALLNGTAMVKAGDIVRRGDVLAAAYEEHYEGSQKVRVYIRAEGEFWGKVWFTSTRYYAVDGVQYRRTGKSKTHFFWELFLKNQKSKSAPYGLYESKSQTVKLNFLLPITIHKTKYYELKPELISLTLEKAQELYAAEVMEEARLKVEKDAKILNSYIKASEENGLIRIDAVIETEIKIGTRVKKSA